MNLKYLPILGVDRVLVAWRATNRTSGEGDAAFAWSADGKVWSTIDFLNPGWAEDGDIYDIPYGVWFTGGKWFASYTRWNMTAPATWEVNLLTASGDPSTWTPIMIQKFSNDTRLTYVVMDSIHRTGIAVLTFPRNDTYSLIGTKPQFGKRFLKSFIYF